MFKNFNGYSEDSFYNIETFSDNNNDLESVKVKEAHKSLPLKDIACQIKCTNGRCNAEGTNGNYIYRCSTNNESFAYLKCEGDGDNRKCYNEKANGLCSTGIGGPVSSGFTESQCLNKSENSKQYSTKDKDGKTIVIKDHVKKDLVYKKNIISPILKI